MNLVEWLQRIMIGFGAAWVMWLMIALSVVSVAIILERAWYFWSLRDDLEALAKDLSSALDDSIDAAKKRIDASPSTAAAVVSAGLALAHKGPTAAEEAMAGALALQRMKLERRLAYLGTLGNNAPFIGLFGTVIGIVGAFEALGATAKQPAAVAAAQALAPQAVMSNIAEALVATAVGLAVAIPAVASNNYFQRVIRGMLASTETLQRVLLAHLKGDPDFVFVGGSLRGAVEKKAPASAKPASKGGASGSKKGASEEKPAAADSDEEAG